MSDEFFREVPTRSIPTDLEAAKALSCTPAALDLYMWLSYRCFTAKVCERVPLFGSFGLVGQLGSTDYAARANSANDWGAGSISFVLFGQHARLKSPQMAITSRFNRPWR